jgi:hypothetical protein
MCIVSALMDYGKSIPLEQWTPLTFDYYKVLVENAKYFDHIAKQPHCEDPEKVMLLERIEKHLSDLNLKVDSVTARLQDIEHRTAKLEPPEPKVFLLTTDVITDSTETPDVE